MIVVVELSGLPIPPEPVFVPLFLLSLALFPLALLIGITRRVRVLEERLVESRERLVNAEDAARRTLERDLHDGVQQQLVAALSLVALAARQATRRPEEAQATVGEVGAPAARGDDGAARAGPRLRPPVLDDAGLVPAIESRLGTLPADVELHTDPEADDALGAGGGGGRLLRGDRGGDQRAQARARQPGGGAAQRRRRPARAGGRRRRAGAVRPRVGRARPSRPAGPGGVAARHLHGDRGVRFGHRRACDASRPDGFP